MTIEQYERQQERATTRRGFRRMCAAQRTEEQPWCLCTRPADHVDPEHEAVASDGTVLAVWR